jgi:ATP-dependent Clp protease ATP-binding subunit ClpB
MTRGEGAQMKSGITVSLDQSLKNQDVVGFEKELRGRIVGQEEAVVQVSEGYQKFLSGFSAPNRPVSNFLFLGPTGVGKTRMVEAMAEILFDSTEAVIKIDCSEFQASHDIAKIIGAPPGYVGHNEKTSNPLITQEKLDKSHTKDLKLSLVLFDEIEKANESLWNLLLGILDKAKLTTGNGAVIDFSKSMIFLTSNLGAKEMVKTIDGSLGFGHDHTTIATDRKLDKAALGAAQKQFSPEFMNRIDYTIVFKTLKEKQLEDVLKIELNQVQKRIITSDQHQKFSFTCTQAAHKFLLDKGTDQKYGARYLKRTIEKYLVLPLASLVMTGQVELGDCVIVGANETNLLFKKIPASVITSLPHEEWSDFQSAFEER